MKTDSEENQMFFFIADISGYTSYMLTNQREYSHAKFALSELVRVLIKQVSLPMQIAKLEGDAVFVYLQDNSHDVKWLSKKIFEFFYAFDDKIKDLMESKECSCGACQNLDKLNLKIIAHFGHATIEKMAQFKELFGLDVVIVHRLLKNHVPKKRYLLLTEAAYRHLIMPADIEFIKTEEFYDDVGQLTVYVCDLPLLACESCPDYTTRFYKFRHYLVHKWDDFLLWTGIRKHHKFRNLP